jgi:hypothetical protein
MINSEDVGEYGSVDCRHCGAGMRIQKVKKHPGQTPYVIGGLGLFFSIFLLGPLIGVPMILLALYMGKASDTISLCSECGYYFQVYLKEDDS